MVIYLQHLEGSKKGQIDSFDADRVRIGRLPDNDLSFDPEADRAVSGHHAEIYFAGGSATVRDLQSRNGTYVNSRRIDQPTPLSDGDTIQFAAKGPKVVFSKRDPSGGTTAIPRPGAPAAARPEVRREAPAPPPAPPAPDRAPAAPARGPAPSPPPAAAPRRWLRLAAFIVGGAVVLAALAFAAWWSWTAFAIVLGIVVVAAGGVLLWWWLRRRRRAAPRGVPEAESVIGPDAPGDPESLRELRRKWADALTMLRKSNLKGRQEDPTYGVPWVLVLGETGCGKTETVRSANPISWLSPSGGHRAVTVTRNCDWWFFDSAVLLDTAGRYTFPSAGPGDEAEWRELLSLLKRSRGREPLNGVIVAVAADTLVSRPLKQLQEEASQFRRRLDEMLGQLGTTCPVYLLVTKMDLVSGFTECFRGLPDALRGQAMGAANEDVDNRAGATAFFDRAFRGMVERLDRLRLARLDEEESLEVLRRIYLFPEEFRGLRAAVRGFTEALFRQNPYRETPLFRGLLFTSARQGGVPFSPVAQALGFPHRAAEPVAPTGVLFGRDIFTVLLPQDRPLVERTALSSQRTERTQVVAFWATAAVAVLVCALLTLSFVRNMRALRRLDLEACLTVPGASAEGVLAPRLRQLDACRETIEGLALHSLWARVASNFGLNQTGLIEEPLQARYLETFRLAVLDPLEARIDQKLAAVQEAPAYVSVLVQQIKWLAQCRARGECPPQDKSLLSAYRVMLGAEYPGLREGDPRVGQLARTHEAYVWWQPSPQALGELQAKYTKRVMGWLQAGGLRPDSILASARSQFPPVRARDFWGAEGGAQVEPPYTRRAWLEGLQPLLAGLKAMAPDQREVAESIARFEADYRAEVFRQWGQFLASFPQGERLAAGGRRPGRELAVWILGPDSAYRRVLDTAAANVAPFMGGSFPTEDIPTWALTLQRYADLKAKAAEGKKGGKAGAEDRKAKAGGANQEAVGYLTGYWDAVEQLRGELSTPERAFRAAQKALEEGESSETPTVPLQKALWNRERLQRTIGARQGEDRMVWALVDRPSDLAWRAILDQAGTYVQNQWEAMRPALLELSPGMKQSRVAEFVNNGPAAPFLERRQDSYREKKLLGENLSFTGPFLSYLGQLRSRSPEDFGRAEPPRQVVAAP